MFDNQAQSKMNLLTFEQMRRNRSGRDRWEFFAPHRRQVTNRLLGAARLATDRLCVLGAGNANDLDLNELQAAFAQVHLVDLDGEALEFGRARQSLPEDRSILLHGGVDVTGIWAEMATWTPDAWPSPERLETLLASLPNTSTPALPKPFDVVVSTCLQSQIIEAAAISLGADHQRLLELVLALRTAHIRTLAELLAPGGRGLLIADFVSCKTVPELRSEDGIDDCDGLLERLVRQGNFFFGLNPYDLESICRDDAHLASLLTGARQTGVWRWDLGNRAFLVCAIEFERRRDDGESSIPLDSIKKFPLSVNRCLL